jgi:hypothetical protein
MSGSPLPGNIDWNVVATIGAPIITLFVGAWVNRCYENRPVLISYFGHVAAFTHHPGGGQGAIQIHTHSVVLRNTGRLRATNVRIHHTVLPDFNIWPGVAHTVETLPDGTKDIVIPTLVPGEQVTISYLYFAPVTYAQVNAGIKSDHGFAKQIPVLLQRQYPTWSNATVAVLMLVGLISLVYLLYRAVMSVVR